MKKFIGRDARYIQVEDGLPVNVFDLPDGVRAFQYYWGGGRYVVPKTTSTAGEVQLVGNAAYYSERQIETGGAVIDSPGCLITYLTKWDAAKQGWIVTSISYPHRLVC
jgi:hypothetical protein